MMETHIKEPEKKVETVVSREDFLAKIRVKPSRVKIDEIGEIEIRGLTASEVQGIKSGSTDIPGGKPRDDMFAILTVVTGLVSPVLTKDDIAALKKEGKFGIVHKISAEIMKLSGIGEEAKNA